MYDRVALSVFTSLPCAMQICLHGEPLFSLQPETGDVSTRGLVSNSHAAGELGGLHGDK